MMEPNKSTTGLTFVKNHEINLVKWDNCINNAHNGSIYAFSWYLDIICEDWTAIIQHDYEGVMPLLHKKKAGLSYVYPSLLANQLGVFSTEVMGKQMVNAFIKKTAEQYRMFTVNLNKFNRLDANLFHQQLQSTYEFDLIRSHHIMQENYSQKLRRNIRKGRKNQISIIRGITPNHFIDFLRERGIMVSGSLSRDLLAKLRRIIAFVLKHGLGEIYAAYTPENNLCAAVFFLRSNRKVKILFSGVSGEGRERGAPELLIDEYIKRHAEKNLTMNFENLALPDKAEFCEGFGGKHYQHLRVSNQPFPFLRKLFS
jgi:hypothetical protein